MRAVDLESLQHVEYAQSIYFKLNRNAQRNPKTQMHSQQITEQAHQDLILQLETVTDALHQITLEK